MPIYTTVDKIKTHLGIPSAVTSEDARLTQLLAEIEPAITNYIGRNLVSAARTEYLDGTGRPLLVLRHRPVTAIASVHVDGAGYYGHGEDGFPATSQWTIGNQFAPKSLEASEDNSGLLVALGGEWPRGMGNIKVVYTAGYATMPLDLELAANQLVALVRSGTDKGGPLQSETIGKYAYTLLAGHVPGVAPEIGTIRGILNGYREVTA